MEENAEQKGGGYSKRPAWQWIAIYVVLAIVVYGAIYFLFLRNKNPESQTALYGGPTPTSIPAPSPTSTVIPTTPGDNIYQIKTDTVKGNYMIDFQGMTLYTFDKDTSGVSNCNDACATLWPPYISGATGSQLPADITVIARADGSMQFAWKNMPLYYYSKDKAMGDLNGDGFNNLWHIVKP